MTGPPPGAPKADPTAGMTAEKAIIARLALSVRAAGISMQDLATAMLMQLRADIPDSRSEAERLVAEAKDRIVLMNRRPDAPPEQPKA